MAAKSHSKVPRSTAAQKAEFYKMIAASRAALETWDQVADYYGYSLRQVMRWARKERAPLFEREIETLQEAGSRLLKKNKRS